VEKDISKGFQWALKAAKQGHARCEWFAGLMYGRGEGTSINREEGIRLICAAARQKFAYAKVTLDMMSDGDGEFPAPVEVELAAAGYEAGFKAAGTTLEDLPMPAACAGQQ
jgi:TPR repeat protein